MNKKFKIMAAEWDGWSMVEHVNTVEAESPEQAVYKAMFQQPAAMTLDGWSLFPFETSTGRKGFEQVRAELLPAGVEKVSVGVE